ncbi:MAG: HEAT repeat domain-containing protein [Planctomycetaceae bacterium]
MTRTIRPTLRMTVLMAVAAVCCGNPLGAAEPGADLEAGKVHLVLQGAALGDAAQFGGDGARFFVARVEIVNRTDEPVTFVRKDARLTADGQRFSDRPLPQQSRYLSFSIAGKMQSLNRLDRPEQTAIPAGKSAEVWVTFRDLPRGAAVPRLTLDFDFGEQQAQLDVTAESRDRLKLDVARIGPHEALGLLTISGEVNGINAGEIAAALDKLVERKVRRAVIRFTKEAQPLPGDVRNWLEEAAHAPPQAESNFRQFPTITRALRELHLAQLPGESSTSRRRSRGYGMYGMIETPSRVHDSDREAIVKALENVYRALPQDQLLAELHSENAVLRTAAISGGGGRFPVEALPELIAATRAGDALLKDAAIAALGNFGEPAAVDRLVELSRAGDDGTAQQAIQALAASRFAVAHAALDRLLAEADAKSRTRIVEVLAEHPDPRWADPIHECAARGDSRLRLAAVKALVTIGHPRLTELLKSMLAEKDTALRQEAFRILVERTDPESERIALEYALTRLEDTPPDPPTINLLSRTRDSRAVPLLLEHFEKSAASRPTVINLLSRVGDQRVEAFLIEKYPELHPHEKSAALDALMQLRSTRLRPLAVEALATGDGSLVGSACQALLTDGGPEAVAAIAAAFEKSTDANVWSQTANALSSIGTPECYAALDRGRKSGNRNKREVANNALRNLRQQSPGYQYIWQAQEHLMDQKWEQGQRMFENAIKLDPNLPDAYVGRGTARLHLGQVKEARADMEKAIELDDVHAGARTGMGLVLVFEDQPVKGAEYVERHRKDFRDDAAFAYNAACVYARAAEKLAKMKDDDDAAKLVAEFRDKAIADLRQAARHGFRDYEHLQRDPDLKSLHDHPEFEKAATPGEDGNQGG